MADSIISNGFSKKINTSMKQGNGVCQDGSSSPIKAQTIDELHSLQKKRSTPSTPSGSVSSAFSVITEEDRQRQQLQSIRYHVASSTLIHGNFIY